MSISNLFYPNEYNLFCNSITANTWGILSSNNTWTGTNTYTNTVLFEATVNSDNAINIFASSNQLKFGPLVGHPTTLNVEPGAIGTNEVTIPDAGGNPTNVVLDEVNNTFTGTSTFKGSTFAGTGNTGLSTFTFTFTGGAGANLSGVIVTWEKWGSHVALNVAAATVSNTTGFGGHYTASSVVPSGYRPTSQVAQSCKVTAGGTSTDCDGTIYIDTNGNLQINISTVSGSSVVPGDWAAVNQTIGWTRPINILFYAV